MRNFYYSIINTILFCSCTHSNTILEQTLRMAGDNRPELEKVLHHYSQNPTDSLKLQAARFLIENMPGHHTLEGDLINEYREKIYADTSATYFAKKSLEICMTHVKNIQDVSREDEDVRHIKADFLIHHIDRSFEKLERYSWLHDLPFDIFLEYILPYRVGYERLDSWIDSLEILPETLEAIKHSDNIKFSTEGVWSAPSLSNAGFQVSSDLMHELFKRNIYEDCKFISIKNSFYSLAAAFPESLDCIPVYANRNGYHYWNAIRSSESKITTVNEGAERKASKIFRRTFSRQSTPTPETGEYIPEFFLDPFYKDVTSEYMYTANVHVNPRHDITPLPRHAYLCVFNNLDWQPVVTGDLSKNGAEFKEMGKNLVYLPVCYRGKKMKALHYPFILNQKGEINYLVPDTTTRQALHLTRKYPLAKILYDYNKNLKNTIITASLDPEFQHSDTTRFIPNQASTYAECTMDTCKSYRYYRITATTGYVQAAEFFFINSGGEHVQVEADPKFIKGFDGDPLTNITWCWEPQIIVDLKQPVALSKIIALPPSDGNGIYPGDEYELFYHDLQGWQSLGRQVSTGYHLDYTNVPKGALYWLHNRTKGVEERIFTVTEKGEIRFW